MRILSTVCRNMYGQMVLGVLTHAQAKGDTTLGEKTVVNSWNEWDPLKHVIVGRADDCHIPPEEPALDAKVPEDSDMRGQWGRRPQETIDRGNELLDNFVQQLKSRGIRVDRPTSIDHSTSVATPDFYTDSQFGCIVAPLTCIVKVPVKTIFPTNNRHSQS